MTEAARCEVCGWARGYGKGLCYAHVPDYYDYEISACFRRGYERLKAENASLLESLREYARLEERRRADTEKHPFTQEWVDRLHRSWTDARQQETWRADKAETALAAAEQRAEAAEKERDAAKETVKRHGISARRLGNELEGMTRSRDTVRAKLDAFIRSEGRGALRQLLRESREALDPVLNADLLARIRAALHDEERSAPPQESEK